MVLLYGVLADILVSIDLNKLEKIQAESIVRNLALIFINLLIMEDLIQCKFRLQECRLP